MVQTEVDEMQRCACKGIRFCAACKNSPRVAKVSLEKNDHYAEFKKYVYLISCNMAVHDNLLSGRPGLNEIYASVSRLNEASSDYEDHVIVPGLHIVPDFLSETEEIDLVNKIDETAWTLSQSGRRKQDYGPQVNFKHRKVKFDRFIGMPAYIDMILKKMNSISDLYGSYQPFELCNLEYSSDRWSAIEMHCDDTWIWGPRLISLNLLSNSVLTCANEKNRLIIYVPLPRRTMVCMTDEVRYSWKHAVFAEHICGRRIALTMREPSAAFKEGGELYEKFGQELTRLGNIRI